MKRLVLALLPFMFGCSTFHVINNNKYVQHSLHVVEVSGLIIDYGQTLYISNHPEFHENNMILGKHPSSDAVNAYFVSSLMLNEYIYWNLPKKYRNLYSLTIGAIEFSCIRGNIKTGLKVDF